MKKTRCLIFIIIVLMLVSYDVFGQSASKAPFTKGVNFSAWFEYIHSAQAIPFTRYVEQDFTDVKGLGCDVIRLPIDFNVLTSGAPGYIIDPFLFTLLDKAVDWAEKYQIYILLDNHPANQPAISNEHRNFLISVWKQMAEHYKNRSEYVIYEIQNEPNGIDASAWGKMQGDAIDAIRKIDKNHWIVVSGVEWSSVNALSSLPKYSDKKLLYTFHFYDPHLFTHQGAAWSEPLLVHLAGIPFPYDKNRMPQIPNKVKGSWLENDLKNYSITGTTAEINKKLDQAADFGKQRNAPVFCGEFGVYMRNSLPEDRVRWYQVVREALEARNISRISWDYYEPFGIFNPPGGAVVFYFSGDINTDLNVEVVRALGLNPPPQKQKQIEPLKTGFTIYDDYLSRGSFIWISSRQNTFDFYYTPAAEGEYAIRWGNINRKNDYMRIRLSLSDYTYLAQNGFVLEFKAKAEKQVAFDIKFYSFHNGIEWNNGYNIDQKQLPPDGKWHTIRIPLCDMQLWGGWDTVNNKWLEPSGRTISWTNINLIDFTMTNKNGYVCEIYLDEIKITK